MHWGYNPYLKAEDVGLKVWGSNLNARQMTLLATISQRLESEFENENLATRSDERNQGNFIITIKQKSHS